MCDDVLLGGLLLTDESISSEDFHKYADEVLLKAKNKGNQSSDDESLSKDPTGRNNHNIPIYTINDFE